MNLKFLFNKRKLNGKGKGKNTKILNIIFVNQGYFRKQVPKNREKNLKQKTLRNPKNYT